MTIRAVIVDDESLARKNVKRFLATEPDISVIGECGGGGEAINVIQELSPDLLFLDIQMPGIDGFEVLHAIRESKMPIIIFVTAYDQHALKAFEIHALDYLLKPLKQERFKRSIERVRTQMAMGESREITPGLKALIGKLETDQNHVSRFMIKSSNRVVLVKTGEIDWIESAANYALLHVGDKNYVVRETMQALEAKLSPKSFQRISRSAIVNLERIKELQPMGKGQYVIILTNGMRLTMSRGIRDLQHVL
jgi:two-component system LytT family response regulator